MKRGMEEVAGLDHMLYRARGGPCHLAIIPFDWAYSHSLSLC